MGMEWSKIPPNVYSNLIKHNIVGDNAQTVFPNKGNSSVYVSDDVERAAPHCKFEWPKDQYSKRRKHATAGPNKSRERKLLSSFQLTANCAVRSRRDP